MCTAITYAPGAHYFGRNLDLDRSLGETVTITPRRYPFAFRRAGRLEAHYAMIGVAHVADGCPLYYDAVNEKGLAMAGLNFPLSAKYQAERTDRDNVAPFEFIPWLLGQCADLEEARRLLARANLIGLPFSDHLPLAPLHWLIADRSGAVAAEPLREGLSVQDDPAGVLTNEPPFAYQMLRLNDYMQLTREAPRSSFGAGLELRPYCLGMGAMGLPGDLSSASRFVRAAFTRLNSVSGPSEAAGVSQVFHILASVAQTRGCARAEGGGYEITVYSSCCNLDSGVYYYTTYENSRITAVDLKREDLDGTEPVSYPLIREQEIWVQNEGIGASTPPGAAPPRCVFPPPGP